MRSPNESARPVARTLLLACVSGAAGCTLEAGHGFATVAGGYLQMELEPGAARDLGNRTLLTNLGYEVHLERAEVSVQSIELAALQGTSTDSSASFDPSDPPEGYSLCHGGHCHAEDGSLVSYDEVSAELAGGGSAQYVAIATLPVAATISLWSNDRLALGTVEPSAELPQTRLRRIGVHVEHLHLMGSFAGGSAELPSTPFEIDIPLTGSMDSGVDLEIDRDGPSQLHAGVSAQLDGTWFDDVDFADLGPPIRIESVDHELAITASQRLLATDPILDINP